MTVLLGVSMGAHAVRMALPRNGTAVVSAPVSAPSPARLPEAPRQLFFKNQVIDAVGDDVEYLAAESISAVAAETDPLMATGVAYRDAHQADTLHRALEHQHLQNYHLVHEVEAVVEYLVASGEAAGYSTVALFDLGSSGLNVSVVDLANRRVIVTMRSTEVSGDLFDAILRDNQLDRLGKPIDAPDIDLFTRRCRVAKERLSGNDAVCLPDESGMILLSRDSYETLITDEVERSIEFARNVLIGAHVPIDAVVLIGGGSRIPLVRKRVGPSLDLPALTPNEPESVAARGAALSARPTDNRQPNLPRPAVKMPTRAASAGGVGVATSLRPTDATPTISISRDMLPTAMPPLGAADSVAPVGTAYSAETASGVTASGVTASSETASFESAAVPTVSAAQGPPEAPVDKSEEPESGQPAPGGSRHFALSNVYWLAADYEDDDGEDEDVRRRRVVRSWSIVGVAAAALIAVSGFLLTRPSSAPTVADTAVTQAPASSVVATTPPAPVPSAPVVPVAPPPPPPEPTTTEVQVVPQPVEAPQNTVRPTATEQAPAPQPTEVLPPPPPEPPPLIPGLPDFTLPTIPPLFP